MINVLLVDDHELVRSGIEALLNAVEGICVPAVCDSGEMALTLYDELSIDIVLMDINMPGIGGIEASRQLLQAHPQARILGLSAATDRPLPQQLFKLGVAGFISKASPVSEMVTAIQTVVAGDQYLGEDIALNLSKQSSTPLSPFEQLSQREAEVVQLILAGKSIQEMAEALNICDKTVNTYRYRLYQKLNIKNDVELTRLVIKHNHPNGVGF